MSIDHGRLLALADHAAALSHRLSRMGGDSVFRAVEAREIEQGLRALAQPAEAVEGSGSVAALVAAANAVLAENPNDDTMWSLEAAVAPFNARKPAECADGCPPKQVCDYCQVAATDAAQGAVARVAWRSDPDQGTYLVAEWLGPLPEPGELLFTHPQAAPAQGDVPPEVRNAIDFLTGLRVFVTSRQRIKEPEGDNLFDESVATIRKWLAAAPSQEGGS